MDTQQEIHRKIVEQLLNYWRLSISARNEIDKLHSTVVRSYNGILPEKVLKSKAVQTKTHLGWTAKAIDTFTDRLSPLLMPDAKTFFTLYDSSQVYALPCSIMSALMGYFFQSAGMDELTPKLTTTMGLEGAAGLQPTWDYINGVGKLPRLNIQLINPQDVGIYPITEPIERAIMMLRTYKTRQELIDMAEGDQSHSYDLQTIMGITEKEVFSRPVPRSSVYQAPKYDSRLGHEIIDYYAPVLQVGEDFYYHVRATVASGKYLIRFVSKETPDGEEFSGAIYATLKEMYAARIGPVRIGVGICDKAIDLEMAAITVHNLGIDSIKDMVKPPRQYDPTDMYFNPQKPSYAPGELIARISTNPYHLMPIPGSERAAPQAEEVISRLQYQFEALVGIPNFLSGTSDTDDRRVSATAKRLEANGADTALRRYGLSINQHALYPLAKRVYSMIRSVLQAEIAQVQQAVTELANQGQQVDPMQVIVQMGLPLLGLAQAISTDFQDWFTKGAAIPPIEVIGMKLSTFEDAIQKVDQLNSCERLLGTLAPLAQDPEIKAAIQAQIDFNNLIRTYASDLDLETLLKPLSQVAEALQANGQQQQAQQQKNEAIQAAQVQLEAQKLQAEIDKLNADTQKAQAEIQKIQAETIQVLNPEPKPNEQPRVSKQQP